MSNQQISNWVIEKNNQFVAFNKPAGLSVQPDKGESKALLELAEIYAKKKLFLIHRIDQPASGTVVFAKTKRALQSISQQFIDRKAKKVYLAIVKQKPRQDKEELLHFLKRDGRKKKSIVVNEKVEGAKKAVLNYELLHSSDNYHLLKIELGTGRFHQIRAQLAAIGCPIKGDVKYGFRRKNEDRSIHLHAWKLHFIHPVSGESVDLVSPIPEEDKLWAYFSKQIIIKG